jgi:ribosomal protein S18 acetylase RimI-like enzyme
MHIRWMIRRDLDTVLNIDKYSHAVDEHWNSEEFKTQLRERNMIAMVAETDDGIVVGYVVYALHKTSLTIIRFGVHLDYLGGVVEAAILDKLRGKLSAERRTMVEAAVADTDTYQQQQFAKNGFIAYAVQGNEYLFRNRHEWNEVALQTV